MIGLMFVAGVVVGALAGAWIVGVTAVDDWKDRAYRERQAREDMAALLREPDGWDVIS